MKHILLVSLLLLIAKLNSQIVPSSCNGTDSIVKKYKNYADILAVRRVFKINSPYKDSININKPISNNYLKAFLAIQNATSLPARDTVISILKIKLSQGPEINRLFFGADSNQTWVKKIKGNVFPTGYSPFDSLKNKYSIQKIYANTVSWGQNIYFYLKADTNVNIKALTDKVLTFPGTVADGMFYIDGNNITDSINPNFIQLSYTFKWGDCPSGCTGARTWTFKVFNDCSVEYIGSYGDSLEPIFLVGLNENTLDKIRIYPNPFTDKLRIDLVTKNLASSTEINIHNILGQNVFTAIGLEESELIDLGYLNSGVYYLDISNAIEKRVVKIVKE